MARKPNYNFERMERERQKAIKAAEKAAAKKQAREQNQPQSDTAGDDPDASEDEA